MATLNTPGGINTDYQQDSPNQQSLVLECSVCAEQYGPDFGNQPRSLRCGHTFCTSCLMKIMSSRGVPCAMCSRLHPLSSPDVMLLPINYAVQDIMKNFSSQEQEEQNSIRDQPELPPCGVCQTNSATVVCVDCDPGNYFKFCGTCDHNEHTRPFGPAQRHKRFPIDQAPVPGSSIYCSRHSQVIATLYSESLNEFACNMCVVADDHAHHYEPITEATLKIRAKVKKLTKYTNDMTKQLSDSKQNLEMIMNRLEPDSMTVKTMISKTFSRCVEVLQERQRMLLANVEVELRNRKESLTKQHEAVTATNAKFRDAFESLNSLVSKSDVDFILHYRRSTQHIEPLFDNEDKSLLRPLVNQDIPFYINKDVEKQLSTLGAVGGGLTPTDLECSPSGTRGTLMELYWQLPEGCGKLNRFQIEYEQVLDSSIERRGSGLVEATDIIYTQSEPQFYEVPGNELTAYVDYLCPGYDYRFRIRSANDAGFGMWSDPIVAKCANFPFTLEYTKKIHRIIIPKSGYYRITVKGAKAADGIMHRGGKGAIISAVFSLKASTVLIMLCGGMSSKHHYHSGGGGGSFVALNEMSQDSLLLAAGGGGGTRGADENDFDGRDASVEEAGFDGLGDYFGRGGKNGCPGEDARDSSNLEGPSWGNGGAGFMQDSSTALSFVSGGHAGQNGGFGGGGAVGMYGGGGGGGYSGGGGGRGGGGGGSYVISTAVEVTRSVGSEGHGSITIESVVPPYPISSPFVNRVSSTGGDSSTSSNSFTQLSERASNDRIVHLDSSSSISTKPLPTGNSIISNIPEMEALHQSPSSTGQVMDQPDNPSPVVFGNEFDDGLLEAARLVPHDSSNVLSSEVDLMHTNASAQPVAIFPNLASNYSQSYNTASTSVVTTVPCTVHTATPALIMEEVTVAMSYPLGSAMMDTLPPGGSSTADATTSAHPSHAPQGPGLVDSTHSGTNVRQLHQPSSTVNATPASLRPAQASITNLGSSGSGNDHLTSQWVSQLDQEQNQQQQQQLAAHLQQVASQQVASQQQQQQQLSSQQVPQQVVFQMSKQNVSPPLTGQLYQTHPRQQQQQQQNVSPPLTQNHQPRQNVSPPLTQRHPSQPAELRTDPAAETWGYPPTNTTNKHHAQQNW